jgi:ElaB/YqjD/DUF883 family membrane-anchored ribosome-binding protein
MSNDLESKFSATIEKLESEVERLKQTLSDALSRGEEVFQDEAEEIRERFMEGADELEAQIEANPIRSALIAVGIGFVLGRLLSR